jgi:stage V sporulation protein G
VEITEVRLRLADPSLSAANKRLLATASLTIDDSFVVRDIKVIDGGGRGGMFLAMPSRRLLDACPKCGGKNHLLAKFCNDCGSPLPDDRASLDHRGRPSLHADLAHPIHEEARLLMQAAVLSAYEAEVVRSERPGYSPGLSALLVQQLSY